MSNIAHVIADLRRDTSFMAKVSAWETLPARPAQRMDVPATLHPALTDALHRRGMQQLYSHQAEAIALALAGHNVAVVTPTASGKTLCYNLPVFHALLSDPNATALYLFPTKALAHDQLTEISSWQSAIHHPSHGAQSPWQSAAYDGDTPPSQRGPIRQNTRLLVTNPDMLHTGILPFHGRWERFLRGLRYVIIDEMHSYRGVFGSHVANVLRRLQRVVANMSPKMEGNLPSCSHPHTSLNRTQFTWLLTSATIANPKQLAEALTEQPIRVIDSSGAPHGEKHVLLYAPPLYDPARGLRRSSVLESQKLAIRFLRGGLQTIVFGRARLTVEVLLSYIREHLAQKKGTQFTIRGYRGGYLPQERREIEAGLRAGTVRGVVATNALELGIDIGQLEAAVICGYPGTIASTWQQWGRVGRTTQTSLAVLVASAGALDQFIVNHPKFLLERSPEHAFINADNLMLLVDQMRCAAFELPFVADEPFGQSPFSIDVLKLLAEEGTVQPFSTSGHPAKRGDVRWLWSGASYPSRQVHLRSVDGDPVVIQTTSDHPENDTTNASLRSSGTSTVIGEVEATGAPLLVHEGAVYIHEGQNYLVERLDLDEHLAWVRPANVDFYTEAITATEIQELSVHGSRVSGGAQLGHGDLLVTSQVTQYRRVRRFTHENLGILPLEYPPSTLDTAGYWLEVTAAATVALMKAGHWRDLSNDYGSNWQEQRAKVRARDGYRCSECGRPESTNRQHDVHHLIPFRTFGYMPGLNENYRQANQLNNLVLLCRHCHQCSEASVRTRTGLDGLAYVLGNLTPLHLMCDRRDIDVAVIRPEVGAWKEGAHRAPRIYIYERIPAGLGFSAQLYERHDQLIAESGDLVRACPCRHGCPACVGPILLHAEEQQPLLETKRLTLALLHVLASATQGDSHVELNSEVNFWS